MTETKEWRVTWFPPDKPILQRTVADEAAARILAAAPNVEDWFPIIEYRVVSAWQPADGWQT